jgi:hypothetical protein
MAAVRISYLKIPALSMTFIIQANHVIQKNCSSEENKNNHVSNFKESTLNVYCKHTLLELK